MAFSGVDFEVPGASNPRRVYFTPGSYDIVAGKDTATLSIDIRPDNVVEETANEVFRAMLKDTSSSAIRGVDTAEVTITDNDGMIDFF